MVDQHTATQDIPQARPNHSRRRYIAIALSIFCTLGIVSLIYWAVFLRYTEYTDDAYVTGNLVQITPQVAGTITAIMVDETDFVKAGSTVVVLDPVDAQLAFDRARAQLAQAVRQVRHIIASNTQLESGITLSKNELAKAQADLARRKALLKTDATTKEEIAHASVAVANAQAAYKVAVEKLKSNQVLVLDQRLAEQPAVLSAAALVRETYLALKRTKIVSPVDGYLIRRVGQIGQRVNVGQNLMAVVPLDEVWVEANFKEVQLARIRIGQPVTLTADVYDSQVTYHGRVVGLGAGTGSAVSVLPAQNATGNWIKVVQRVPVRIALQKAALEKYPLRIGLSMRVEVDTHDQSGLMLAKTPRQLPVYRTDFRHDSQGLEQMIQHIIIENAR